MPRSCWGLGVVFKVLLSDCGAFYRRCVVVEKVGYFETNIPARKLARREWLGDWIMARDVYRSLVEKLEEEMDDIW